MVIVMASVIGAILCSVVDIINVNYDGMRVVGMIAGFLYLFVYGLITCLKTDILKTFILNYRFLTVYSFVLFTLFAGIGGLTQASGL